ncbi:hypothetical protein [Christiangramia sabulilitoris]|uniref:Uncharacterized protein n=1 Tax=Christiangramia sabulilitoris TaxID=2583991 RepID=A0A550I648_9FLAO|nr:hypothetical protein [Christiangramia sabulilitoris]TRO66454.1 hypothetical protein FGM01_00810 [Christiangramia sabulilitoris]
MKTLKFFFKTISILLVTLFMISCESEIINSENIEVSDISARSDANIVDVYSIGLNFNLPEEIPSGWTTFRYHNQTPGTHFFTFAKLPEGKTVADWEAEIIPPFQDGMNYIAQGDFEAAFAAFGSLPAWFAGVVYSGGVGFVSGGETAMTTHFAEPGRYVMECYVKNQNGEFHSYKGMLTDVVVTSEETRIKEPKANIEINLSSTSGIEIVSGNIRPGKHTIGVNFVDQSVYSHFLGHDFNLVRIDDPGANLSALEEWMVWSTPGEFESPGPEGFTFLGGVQDMQAGSKAYINTVLKPGNYAFIAEVPDASGKGMLVEFSVPTE